MIQLGCVDELANHVPVPLPMQVHAEHFPEINLTLSKSERVSINAIYNLVCMINNDVQSIQNLNRMASGNAEKMQSLRLALDTVYRNSHHLLLLIQLHAQRAHENEHLLGEDQIRESEARNDEQLLQLAAEARKNGAAWVRAKHRDGATSPADIAPCPPPVPGKFYYDVAGAKYKCMAIADGKVTWFQLEGKLGLMTFDAIAKQPLESVRHIYPISDEDEIARLERRCVQLQKQSSRPNPPNRQ
jgi:hypothetical protein